METRSNTLPGLRRGTLLALAAVVPLVVCWAFSTVRDAVGSTTVVLVLVLVVVACAATGDRVAGIVAALSSGLWFDVLLTEPYGRLDIWHAEDVEATLLLLVAGIGVSELAAWGGRAQARLGRRAGYLDGVLGVADLIASPQATPEALQRLCSDQIVRVLGIDAAGTCPPPPEVRRRHRYASSTTGPSPPAAAPSTSTGTACRSTTRSGWTRRLPAPSSAGSC